MTSIALGLLTASCNAPEERTVAVRVAESFIQACPMATRDDLQARAKCAGALTESEFLRETMVEPFIWGGQHEAGVYDLTVRMNRFNPLVWRRMYVSLFMFTGKYTIKEESGFTVVHMEAFFRNDLQPGDYPYPFWHKASKWQSYEKATELLFLVKDDKLVGAMRSATQDASRPQVERHWDGFWIWTQGEQQQPYVSFYDYLLSPNNPHKDRLNTAYVALEQHARDNSCLHCHAPDNLVEIGQLEFFNYPNQTLVGRHDLVRVLETKAPEMPPPNTLGFPVGLPEDERLEMLQLAKEFESAGEEALAFEGETTPLQ